MEAPGEAAGWAVALAASVGPASQPVVGVGPAQAATLIAARPPPVTAAARRNRRRVRISDSGAGTGALKMDDGAERSAGCVSMSIGPF